MGKAQIRPLHSRQEYYQLDKMSNVRHEYCDGEIFAMAGGSATHALLIGRMTTVLNNGLAGFPCDAVPCDQRVRIEAVDLDTYPDVVVWCDDARFDSLDEHTLVEPRLLVEVLSSSTAQYDQTTKLEAYKMIPTLSDYLIVWQDKICVEHHAREAENWKMRRFQRRDDILLIPGFAIELPLSEIYRRLDLPEGAENG